MAFTTNYSQERTWKQKIPTNFTNPPESSVSLPVKCRYKNWFHPHIWSAIDMIGKRTNYSSYEIIKQLQSQHQDTNLYDSLASSTLSGWIDFSSTKKKKKTRIKEYKLW